MRRADFSTKNGTQILCQLCPYNCILNEGDTGKCGVRRVINGELISLIYGIFSSIAIDPIEKKPLYHFMPGTEILSLGSYGCTMECGYCQNHHISQVLPKEEMNEIIMPDEIVSRLRKSGQKNIAYTYNEPVLSIEYILELAEIVRNTGGKNVMVSNGYIQEKPLNYLLQVIDAFNIDLKAATADAHFKLTAARLKYVQRSIVQIKHADKHIELTYLIVPGFNDNCKDFNKLCTWLSEELGKDQVLHISRYFPRYKMSNEATSLDLMKDFEQIARGNLNYVYCGNTGSYFDNNTYCPSCKNLLIERSGYTTEITGVDAGCCVHCGNKVEGIY